LRTLFGSDSRIQRIHIASDGLWGDVKVIDKCCNRNEASPLDLFDASRHAERRRGQPGVLFRCPMPLITVSLRRPRLLPKPTGALERGKMNQIVIAERLCCMDRIGGVPRVVSETDHPPWRRRHGADAAGQGCTAARSSRATVPERQDRLRHESIVRLHPYVPTWIPASDGCRPKTRPFPQTQSIPDGCARGVVSTRSASSRPGRTIQPPR
jgi:hypothetical protein